jgi:hypothetical protein
MHGLRPSTAVAPSTHTGAHMYKVYVELHRLFPRKSTAFPLGITPRLSVVKPGSLGPWLNVTATTEGHGTRTDTLVLACPNSVLGPQGKRTPWCWN